MTILRNIPALIEPYKIFFPIISKPCLPLYSDNFSNPGSGWPTTDSGNYVYEYKDGEYRILVALSKRSRFPTLVSRLRIAS